MTFDHFAIVTGVIFRLHILKLFLCLQVSL